MVAKSAGSTGLADMPRTKCFEGARVHMHAPHYQLGCFLVFIVICTDVDVIHVSVPLSGDAH